MKYSSNGSPHMTKYEFLVLCVVHVIGYESRISLFHGVENVFSLGTHLVKRVERFML